MRLNHDHHHDAAQLGISLLRLIASIALALALAKVGHGFIDALGKQTEQIRTRAAQLGIER